VEFEKDERRGAIRRWEELKASPSNSKKKLRSPATGWGIKDSETARLTGGLGAYYSDTRRVDTLE